MAQQSRKPLPPRRSLPPLTFDDPELDSLIANDNHPTEPPPEPRSSLSGLTFGSVPPPQPRARASVAHAPRPSVAGAPRASVAGAPRQSLATAPTQHALRPVTPPAANAGVEAILGALPSIPPEPAVDPSFAPAKDPSFASAPPAPPAPPPAPAAPPAASWREAAAARFDSLVDAAVERVPEWPSALEDVPATVAVAVALVAFFFQLGAGVRWFRGLVRLLAALSG